MWYFLNDKSLQDNRIEFILNLVAQSYDLPHEVRRDKAATFIAYYHQRDENGRFNALKIWQNIKRAFMEILEWHTDRRLFYLIGYLNFCGATALSIKKIAADSLTKSAFRVELKALIFREIFSNDVKC